MKIQATKNAQIKKTFKYVASTQKAKIVQEFLLRNVAPLATNLKMVRVTVTMIYSIFLDKDMLRKNFTKWKYMEIG